MYAETEMEKYRFDLSKSNQLINLRIVQCGQLSLQMKYVENILIMENDLTSYFSLFEATQQHPYFSRFQTNNLCKFVDA